MKPKPKGQLIQTKLPPKSPKRSTTSNISR